MARWTETKRERDYRVKYGIGLKEYGELYEKQQGKCAICEKESKNHLCVDHDHKTGKVRGLLCFRCNFALGYAQESIEITKKMTRYLITN